MPKLRLSSFGAFAVLTLTPLIVEAQVGHPPTSSPYRDIRRGHTVTPMAGYFYGDGGQFNVAPHHGPVFGVRYDIRSSRAIQFGLGAFYGKLQRFIIDPAVTTARTGPVDQSVTFIEFDLQMNPAGGKSWNRLAPFVGIGGGIAFTGSTPADTSGFDLGNKFYLAPSGGFRFFLTQRLHLRAEAKATFLHITYPITFQTDQSGVAPREWTTSWWLQAGLGYSISR